MMESVETVLRIVENDARQNLDGQLDLFSAMAGAEEAPQNDDYQVPNLREYDSGELLKMEKRGLGPVPVRPPVGCLPGKDRKNLHLYHRSAAGRECQGF